MVVCSYFLKGNCRYGNRCKDEHVYNNANHQSVLKKTDVDISVLINSVSQDALKSDKGGQWPLSCYGPFQQRPCFPGFEDTSLEEIRLGYYEAQKNGTLEQYTAQLKQIIQETRNKMMALQSPTPEITGVIRDIYYAKNSMATVNSNGVFGTNTFAGPVTQNSVFANKGQTNMFGGTTQTNSANNFAFSLPENKSIFGNTSGQQQNQGFQTGNSIFGKAATNAFAQVGQNPGMYGNASPQTGSMFQQSTANQNPNLFGSNPTSTPNVFGSNTVTNSNIFANAAVSPTNVFGNPVPSTTNIFGTTPTSNSGSFGTPTNATNAFGTPLSNTNVFGNTPPNANIFRNTAASPQTNVFANPTATSTASTNIFTNPISGATTNIFANPLTSTSNVNAFGTTPQTNIFANTLTAPANTNIFAKPVTQPSTNSGFGPATNAGNPFGGFAQTTNTSNAFSNPQPNSIFANPVTTQTTTTNIFAQANNTLPFSHTPQTTTPFNNPTSNSPFQQSEQQPIRNSPFANNAPFAGSNTQSYTANIFGNKTQATITITKIDDPAVYCKLEELSSEEIEEFGKDSFTFGKIPTHAPTIEMC